VASIDSTIILYISGLSCIMMNNVSERQNVVVIHHCLQKVIEALNTAYYTHIHHSLKRTESYLMCCPLDSIS
jgi:hypothetical protein